LSDNPYPKIKDTVAVLERHFGEEVHKIEPPGGKGRG